MSLNRQLWVMVAVVLLLAFLGTYFISTLGARHYLAYQLEAKNVDNATTLALSLSQMEKDPATVELFLGAQFDAGHYRFIRLVGPTGETLVDLSREDGADRVPAWFASITALGVAPGVAQVQDGWTQYGELTVQSDDQFAYADLWAGSLRLMGWFLLTAAVAVALGAVLLRLILKPLRGVVLQAEAIGDRRFLSQPEPRTREFGRLVRAMNGLSARVNEMLQAETQRVEALRLRVEIDSLTGLRNRDVLMAALGDALVREDAPPGGVLIIFRVDRLAELNRQLGREAGDQLLQEIGRRLAQAVGARSNDWLLARLGSADFALMAPSESDISGIAKQMVADAHLAIEAQQVPDTSSIRAGGTTYRRGELRAAVLARADSALAQAEQSLSDVVAASGEEEGGALPTDAMTWRSVLMESLGQGVRLAHFPVRNPQGEVLHYESPARLNIGERWLPAAQFIGWAGRTGVLLELEAKVMEAAIGQIRSTSQALSVTLSPEAMCSADFVETLAKKVAAHRAAAPRLWIEVTESGALRHLPEFRAFCLKLNRLGCKLGLKHAGRQFSGIPDLHHLGLDYLKIDGSIIRSSANSPYHEAFLRSLCGMAHMLGLITIATGVERTSEIQPLAALGVDGVTGPGIRDAE